MMTDSISSLYLDAFVAVAQTRNFTQAAEKLHITQSALSQRIMKLEDGLESSLLIRDRAGVQLTELGHELLRYCQNKAALEAEFLTKTRASDSSRLVGEIRIGGFSSVMRSVVLASLAPLLSEHPRLRATLAVRELRELPDLLRRGEMGMIILDRKVDREDLESVHLGVEKNVLLELRNGKSPDIYLDHDEEDQITHQYLKRLGGRVGKIERRYLGDVYALVDGVRAGVGKAVIPRHLIPNSRELTIVNPLVELEIPVVLHYYVQPYYSTLQKKVVHALSTNASAFL